MSVVVIKDRATSIAGNLAPAADGGGSATVDLSTAGAAETGQRQADGRWWSIGLGLLAIGVAAGTFIASREGGPVFELKAGIGLFAMLYVAAQAIERIAEITSYVPNIGMRSAAGRSQSKSEARKRFNQAIADGFLSTDQAAQQTAAVAAAKANQDLAIINANRACFFFGFNAAIAAIAAGYFDLDLLELMGAKNVPTFLGILVSALAISGGTKPLHDLISKIESNKQNSESSNEKTVV